MGGADTAEKSAISRPVLRAGLAIGVCVVIAGIVFFTWAGRQALQTAGFTGRAGHLTVTGCQGHPTDHQGLRYVCRGDFVSSDGNVAAPDVRLDGDGAFHSDGTAVSARYAGGHVRQTGIVLTAVKLIGVLISLFVIGLGAALVGACTTWRPRRRSRAAAGT